MNLFKYLKSIFVRDKHKANELDNSEFKNKEICKELTNEKICYQQKESEGVITVSQAAKKNNLTRQAIFFAIKSKRLKAKKENDIWIIKESDLEEYFNKKYSRSKQFIIDTSKGFYSISETAHFLGKKTNHIYYLVRMGRLKSHRQGAAILIEKEELHKFAEFYNKKTEKKLNMVS